jgi:zinc transport system substrate-binding protein
MKKFLITLAIVFGISAIPIFIGIFANHAPTLTGKLKVVASFYPLAEFARNVGGNLVDVTNITPAGAEPHDYEPTPQDIVTVHKTNILLLNGNGLDAWGDKVAPQVKEEHVMVLRMSGVVQSLQSASEENISKPVNDPHFWLDPVHAQEMVRAIENAMVQADPTHAHEYRQNGETYIQSLKQLDEEYHKGLAMCKNKEIVTSHNAFTYMAKRYKFTSFYLSGLSPDEEPTASKFAAATQLARQKQIKYIFFESLVSPKQADTIAKEIGAQTLVLNPIEGLTDADIAAGKNYMSEMQNNLKNLRIAMECK